MKFGRIGVFEVSVDKVVFDALLSAGASPEKENLHLNAYIPDTADTPALDHACPSK